MGRHDIGPASDENWQDTWSYVARCPHSITGVFLGCYTHRLIGAGADTEPDLKTSPIERAPC